MATQDTLPQNHRRVFYNLRYVKNRRVKIKLELMEVLFLGCIFFGLSIACNLFAIMGAVDMMFGFGGANTIVSDFNASRCLLLAGFTSFFTAMYAVGILRIGEFFCKVTGRENPLLYQPQTELERQQYEMLFEVAVGLRPKPPEVDEPFEPWDGGTWAFFLFVIGSIWTAYFGLRPFKNLGLLWEVVIGLIVTGLIGLLIAWRRSEFGDLYKWLRCKFTRHH
ncbi:MAG: hypothetical protein NTW48_03140 [Chloroflexi bacterium]|nr:hypothetical protein [Chloroflexota bacterium]